MRVDQEIDKLKSEIFSDNSDKMKAAADRLFEIGGRENVDYLIGLLDQKNSKIRDIVALLIRDNGLNEALEPLLKSINKKEFKGYTGTMVYALEKLDCSKKFNELFDLLFDESSYEVQNHVLSILNEQIFEFTQADLLRVKNKWDKLKEDWNRLNNIDEINKRNFDIDRNVIQEFVDGYVSHLEKS